MKNKKTFNRRTYPNGQKPEVTTRELPPKVRKLERGMQLMCPFCVPPHPIVPNQDAVCGTSVKVVAVQVIIPLRTVRDKGLTCAKCGEQGKGPMVRFGQGFVHLEDCKPGMVFFAQKPVYSRMAKYVYHLKDGWWKKFLTARYGEPAEVKETATNKVEGYAFQRV